MSSDPSTQELQLVIFRLAEEEYALPITKVQEINRLTPVTRLPEAPAFMEGVINLRGRIIPVLDLRKRFSLPAVETEETRIMIVDVEGQTVGMVVDSVNEVVRLPRTSVEPPPPAFIIDARYIEGVGKMDGRLLILLDIDKILTTQEEIALREIKA